MFPRTLHPETDPRLLHQQLAAAKSYGFNLAYPCVYMPSEEFLAAADEIGMLVRFDAPAVLAFQRRGPGGLPEGIAEQDRLIREQWIAALRWTENHPSVIIYGPGSEISPSDRHVTELYRIAKERDPSRLVMSWSGAANSTDLADVGTLEEPVDASETLHTLMEGPKWHDVRGLPGLAHEYCGAEAIPDFSDIPRYGRGLNPSPEREILEASRARGVADLLPVFIQNSRRISALCRRLEIEEVRKAPQLSGYNMWLIQDIPGYPQGIFDPFWNPKWLEPAEFARSNGETVLLMNEASHRTRRGFRSAERVRFEIWVSHHGSRRIEVGKLAWSITAATGRVLVHGSRPQSTIEPFTNAVRLSELELTMPEVVTATAARLKLTLVSDAASVENEWEIWLYPGEAPGPSFRVGVYSVEDLRNAFGFLASWNGASYIDVLVAGKLDQSVAKFLERGGTVLLLSPATEAQLRSGALMRTQFMPRWPLTGGQDISATLISNHPALRRFPNDGFCAYQFYNLIVYPSGSLPLPPEGILAKRPAFNRGLGVAFNLDRLGGAVTPLIRVFGKNENRAYMFEARVGQGRLLATTLRLGQTVTELPEAAWLFRSLLEYVGSNQFRPTTALAIRNFDPWREP
jgi:hypothetical protein